LQYVELDDAFGAVDAPGALAVAQRATVRRARPKSWPSTSC
jgi:hypothetical protein